MLLALLLFLSLLLVIGVGYAALATELVTPPAVVAGDRLVLARGELPGVLEKPVRIGSPLVRPDQELWLFQYAEGRYAAVSTRWVRPDTNEVCPVEVGKQQPGPSGAIWKADAPCDGHMWNFGPQGEPLNAPRGLDRYLVSVSGERVVVNLSRRLQGVSKTARPSASASATPRLSSPRLASPPRVP